MLDNKGLPIFGGALDVDVADEMMYRFYLKKLRLRPGCTPSLSNYKKFQEELHLETALFRQKWFDYRFVHPMVANYIYAHYYKRVFRETYRRHINRDMADRINIYATKRAYSNRDFALCGVRMVNAIWRGRQIADALGAPYPFVINAGFKHTLAFWKRGALPTPGQIYSDRVCEQIVADWQTAQTSLAPHGEHQLYRLEHYAGSRDQDEHQGFLLNLAKNRPNPAALLATFMERRLLSYDKIAETFGAEFVERMKEAA